MSSIISSVEKGSCIQGVNELDNLQTGISWKTTDSSGFQFFAAFDFAKPGECNPTIRFPTSGFHKEYIDSNGMYTVELDLDALRKLDCGLIIQFDAHIRTPNGLAELGSSGFSSLLYNTNLNTGCYAPSYNSDLVSISDSNNSNDGYSNGDSISTTDSGSIKPDVGINPLGHNVPDHTGFSVVLIAALLIGVINKWNQKRIG